MEAVITAIEQTIAQENAIHEQAMADLTRLLDAAKDLSGQRATDGAQLPTGGEAPEAPPSEDEGHRDPEPEPEAAPEPDGRSDRHSVAALTGGQPPAAQPPDRYRGERERAPGEQEAGASAARLVGEANRQKVLLYLVDAYKDDRGAAAGAGWRSPAEIREAVGITRDKIRKHCVALRADGLADMRGTTKDRRYRATRKGTNPNPPGGRMTGTPTDPIEQPDPMMQQIEKPEPALALTKIVVGQVAAELHQPHDAQGQPVGGPQVKLTIYAGLQIPGPDGQPAIVPLLAYEFALDLPVWENLATEIEAGKDKLRAKLAGISLPQSMAEADQVAARAAQAESLRS